ncbi:MAG: hypothetical protein NTZ39_06215 [Methanoregula sp.]|nr:hypothetical protein [Methanoregula sp.]
MDKHPHAHNPPGRTPPALAGTGSRVMHAPSGQGRLIGTGAGGRRQALGDDRHTVGSGLVLGGSCSGDRVPTVYREISEGVGG